VVLILAHATCAHQPEITVKTPEQEAVLRSIRKLIDFWHITLEELVPEAGEAVLPQPEPEPVVVRPKYRHPVSGDTWDGQGSQPEWLREALTRQGYTVEELRCKSDQETDAAH
jgi:DNA-binding protein H-NS